MVKILFVSRLCVTVFLARHSEGGTEELGSLSEDIVKIRVSVRICRGKSLWLIITLASRQTF